MKKWKQVIKTKKYSWQESRTSKTKKQKTQNPNNPEKKGRVLCLQTSILLGIQIRSKQKHNQMKQTKKPTTTASNNQFHN